MFKQQRWEKRYENPSYDYKYNEVKHDKVRWA